MPEKYLTVKEIAERWGVSRSVVYKLVTGGVIPSIRVGVGRGTIRVTEKHAEDYLKNHERDDVTEFAEHFA